MPSGKTVRRGWRSSVATVGWVWHHRMGPRRGPGGVLLSQGWRMGPENMARFLLFDVYDTCMFENRSSQKEGILSLWNGALKFTKVHEIAFAIVFQWSPRPQVCKSFESLAGKVTKIYYTVKASPGGTKVEGKFIVGTVPAMRLSGRSHLIFITYRI